jgi:hypothetical protein
VNTEKCERRIYRSGALLRTKSCVWIWDVNCSVWLFCDLLIRQSLWTVDALLKCRHLESLVRLQLVSVTVLVIFLRCLSDVQVLRTNGKSSSPHTGTIGTNTPNPKLNTGSHGVPSGVSSTRGSQLPIIIAFTNCDHHRSSPSSSMPLRFSLTAANR